MPPAVRKRRRRRGRRPARPQSGPQVVTGPPEAPPLQSIPEHLAAGRGDGAGGAASLYPDSGKLTAEQVAAAMIDAGFPRDVTILAQGIGTSRNEANMDWGKPPDFHYNGICCRGGWQIHDQHGAGKECAGSVRCSTRKAFELWQGAGGGTKGFTPPNPWEAGVAPGDVTQADKAAAMRAMSGLVGGSGILPDLPDPLEAIGQVLEALAQFFVGLGELLLTPEGWLRLAKLAAGALLIVFGFNRLSKETLGVDPVGMAKKATATVALGAANPAARIAGAAGLAQ